ncbi:hypothetical protein BGZ92_011249 [Podila epicladia]|nr:hypothetical protein BGZ92_011249 [Podila epicladia]
MGGKTILSTLKRSLIPHMPQWLLKQLLIKMVTARPKISFLLLAEDTGSAKPSLEKTIAIRKAHIAKN